MRTATTILVVLSIMALGCATGKRLVTSKTGWAERIAETRLDLASAANMAESRFAMGRLSQDQVDRIRQLTEMASTRLDNAMVDLELFVLGSGPEETVQSGYESATDIVQTCSVLLDIWGGK